MVIEGETGILVEAGKISELSAALHHLVKKQWDVNKIVEQGGKFTWRENVFSVESKLLKAVKMHLA